MPWACRASLRAEPQHSTAPAACAPHDCPGHTTRFLIAKAELAALCLLPLAAQGTPVQPCCAMCATTMCCHCVPPPCATTSATTGATGQQLLPPAKGCTRRFCFGTRGERAAAQEGQIQQQEAAPGCSMMPCGARAVLPFLSGEQAASSRSWSCGAGLEVMGSCHLPCLRPQ